MKLIISTILPETSIEWKWPLLTAIGPGSKISPKKLGAFYFAKDLTIVKKAQAYRERPNILLFDNRAQALAATQKKKLQADVILVKEKISFFKSKNAKKQATAFAKNIAAITKAGGVFIFHTPWADPSWYDQLVVEISHDLGFADALKRIDGKGFGFVSPGLGKETRLSTLIDLITKDLRSGKLKPRSPVEFTLLKPFKTVTVKPGDIASFLKKNKHRLDYTGEKRTGTSAKNLKWKREKKATSQPIAKAKKIGVKKARKATAPKKAAKKFAKAKRPMWKMARKKNGGGSHFKPSTNKKTDAPKVVARNFKKIARPSDLLGGRKEKFKTKPKPPVAAMDEREVAMAADEVEKSTPRFVQASFVKKGEKEKKLESLLPETDYTMNVWVGQESVVATARGEELDTAEFFKDEKMKKVTLKAEVRCNVSDKSLWSTIILPRDGDSNKAKFRINTGSSKKQFEAEIFLYHEDRLVQKNMLRIDIRKANEKGQPKKVVMKTEAMLRKNLDNLDGRRKFGGSIVIPDKKDANKTTAGIVGNKPFGLLFNKAVNDLMTKIRGFIEEAANDEESNQDDLNDPGSVKLLKRLAANGNILFEQHLKKTTLNGPLQIVSNREDYTPLEFAYTFPPPNSDAELCPNAKKALKQGKCQNCFNTKAEWQAHVCPFGFWGLSHVIERHNYKRKEDDNRSDYVIRSEPDKNIDPLKVLNNAFFAASNKVDNGNKGLVKKVNEAIKKNCASLTQANKWDDWKQLVSTKKPDNIILIVHLEQDENLGVDAFEIGDELLPVTSFDGDYMNADGEKRTPFVILIGCEATNVEAYGFDAASQLIVDGAGIVLSNFTSIRGRHAGNIVIKLVELLKAAGGDEIDFGTIILRLKQQLLAEGLMVSLSLLSHGDADWKIKI